MKTQKLRTAQQVKAEWLRKGMTAGKWADDNGFCRVTVSQVLTGRNAATYGVGHRIAVMLGLKDGEIVYRDNGKEFPSDPKGGNHD